MLRGDWWRDWRWLTAVGAGGVLVILLGIWVVVRDKDGKEVARVPVPEGGTVTVETAAKTEASTEIKSGDKAPHSKTSPAPLPPWNLPAGSPPPAIAPFDAVKAKEHQAAWAKYLGVEVESENSIGIRFVLIPPGEFDVGSTEAEVAKLLEQAEARNLPSFYIEYLPSEAPKHRVRITKPFWLGVHEVTRGQFRRFVEDRGYQTEAERDGKGGYGLVDGQWKQDPCFVWNRDLGFEQADDHPVGQKSPNGWGLYDMHGNVWEWCQDWWSADYCRASPLDDPAGPTGGSARVYRGGNWDDVASYGRASYRNGCDPGWCYGSRGFRLARTVSSPP